MKYVYLFNEGNVNMLGLLGKKGTNLSETTQLGLPIPAGFIITTEACNQYYEEGEKINFVIQKQIDEYIIKLEKLTGKTLGDKDNPLLVSIRYGTKTTIPNIMDTILNVGLNEEIALNLSKDTDEFRWIWECYLNFIKDYSKLVFGMDLEYFKTVENILGNYNLSLTIDDLKTLVSELKKEYKFKTQTDFPSDSREQLMSVINACFQSWNSKKANILRRDLDIPFCSGMAIYVQSMVFGNINKNCGVGIIYTRDPITGEKNLVGSFSRQLRKKCHSISMGSSEELIELQQNFPQIYNQLRDIGELLENHYRDMQKIEFVIENNKLFIIYACMGKRTTAAALKIVCDFADEQKNLDAISINNMKQLSQFESKNNTGEKKYVHILKKEKK